MNDDRRQTDPERTHGRTHEWKHWRTPLLLTLLPLALATLLWGRAWHGYAERLRADLQRLLPGQQIEMEGFPYRLEARLPGASWAGQRPGFHVALATRQILLDRIPWQRDRQVLSLFEPRLALSFPAFSPGDLSIEATTALASLHLDGQRLERLSIVWHGARAAGALLPALAADELETHLRELPPAAPGDSAAGLSAADSPPPDTPPLGATQLVLRGDKVRFAGGAPLSLLANGWITAPAAEAAAGSLAPVTIASLSLADASDEVLHFSGRMVADGNRYRVEGVVETLCPDTLVAALAGRAAAAEKRTRRPVRMTISGLFPGGPLAVNGAADGAEGGPHPPVRGQDADCPQLRSP